MDVQYLDAVYDSFTYNSPPNAPPLTGCAVSGGPPSDFLVDCSGMRAPYAPEWTANLRVEQTFVQGDGSAWIAGVRAHYQTEMLTGQDFTPAEYQESYWWLDALLTYRFGDDAYSITAFANNLTDETVIANTFQPPFGLFAVGTLRPPRILGLRFAARF
jgi:iron complex outermembrane receptor protein